MITVSNGKHQRQLATCVVETYFPSFIAIAAWAMRTLRYKETLKNMSTSLLTTSIVVGSRKMILMNTHHIFINSSSARLSYLIGLSLIITIGTAGVRKLFLTAAFASWSLCIRATTGQELAAAVACLTSPTIRPVVIVSITVPAEMEEIALAFELSLATPQASSISRKDTIKGALDETALSFLTKFEGYASKRTVLFDADPRRLEKCQVVFSPITQATLRTQQSRFPSFGHGKNLVLYLLVLE